MFNHRKIVIATKHQKELVIAPQLQQAFHLEWVVPEDFDTDLLGTFSGEVERLNDPITTAKQKCLQAMELTGCDLGIASEGSFGNHPTVFLAPADDEFLVLIDKKNEIEIVARELTLETNFATALCTEYSQVEEFAQASKFPSHGLILRKNEKDYASIFKGITNKNQLETIAKHFIATEGQVYVETDMRAMYNPTRMQIIERLTQKLILKMQSNCTVCQTPGFSETDYVKGVPCQQCLQPTESILYTIYRCQKCNHTEQKLFKPERKFEDPMYCNYCNP